MGDATGTVTEDQPRGMGTAGVLLVVVSILVAVVSGLGVLMESVLQLEERPPPSPWWLLTLLVGLGGIPVALLRRTALTRCTLAALGTGLSVVAAVSLVRLLAEPGAEPASVALLAAVLAIGMSCIAVAVVGPRRPRGHSAPDADPQESSSKPA